MNVPAGLVEATRESFWDLVSTGTVLVDLWGPECRPCLALMPHVEELAARCAGEISVVKLEAPKARRLCIELGVMSLPAFILFHQGEELARLCDQALTPQRLLQWVEDKRKEVCTDQC